MALNAYLAISLTTVWLDGNYLFTLLGFSHEYLLSGYVTQALEGIPIKSVPTASDWASRHATTPISGRAYSIARHRHCQAVLPNRRWRGRIGTWLLIYNAGVGQLFHLSVGDFNGVGV